MALPLARLPVVRQVFLDAEGVPLSNGLLRFYETNTTTPLAVYADADYNVPLGVTVDLDAAGRAPSIFLQPQGYRLRVFDSAGDEITDLYGDQVEDVGQTFLATLGTYFASGSKDVTDGYEVLSTDLLITTDAGASAGPIVVQLPAAATRTEQLTIKNLAGFTCAVTPDGVETIDTVAGAYTLPVAASPEFPTITLYPTTAGWFIASSHGL